MSTNPSISSVLTEWAFDPSFIVSIALVATIYLIGLRRLAYRGQHGRIVTRQHIASFFLGLLAIILAFESPIDPLSNLLLSVHMVQHLLLLLIAPPLLLLGKPIPVLLVGAPHGLAQWLGRAHARTAWFRGVTRTLTGPFVAWTLFIGVMLTWHLPALYDAALGNAGVHLLEHLCFLFTGVLFWWVIIQPLPGAPRVAHGWRLLYVFTAMVPGTALGAIFVFASSSVYAFYAALPRLWGIPILNDQGLAGSIMMVGGDFILAIAAIPLFVGAMARLEQIEQARFARGAQPD
jgi:cytochrome c oxidase assembly factor CtaG